VRRRSQMLAEHGWGPSAKSAGNGFTEFPFLNPGATAKPEALTRGAQSPPAVGFPVLRPSKIDSAAILQAAQYCGFRARHFQTEVRNQTGLEHMARINLERALHIDLPGDFQLPVERAVIADARMMSHEWILGNRKLLKCDASSHGDGHFFPGPTDIAWDLAGVIVEWGLDQDQSRFFLDEYRRTTRDSAALRLIPYLIAYCAFRLGFTLSAAHSVANGADRQRFESDAQKYRSRLQNLLLSRRAQPSSAVA
jgi:hypothetical protein